MMLPFHWLALMGFAMALPEKPPDPPSDLHGRSQDDCRFIHEEASDNAKTAKGNARFLIFHHPKTSRSPLLTRTSPRTPLRQTWEGICMSPGNSRGR